MNPLDLIGGLLGNLLKLPGTILGNLGGLLDGLDFGVQPKKAGGGGPGPSPIQSLLPKPGEVLTPKKKAPARKAPFTRNAPKAQPKKTAPFDFSTSFG